LRLSERETASGNLRRGTVRKQTGIAVVLVLGVGSLGVYFGASGQEGRNPWPPAPIVPPAETEGTPAAAKDPSSERKSASPGGQEKLRPLPPLSFPSPGPQLPPGVPAADKKTPQTGEKSSPPRLFPVDTNNSLPLVAPPLLPGAHAPGSLPIITLPSPVPQASGSKPSPPKESKPGAAASNGSVIPALAPGPKESVLGSRPLPKIEQVQAILPDLKAPGAPAVKGPDVQPPAVPVVKPPPNLEIPDPAVPQLPPLPGTITPPNNLPPVSPAVVEPPKPPLSFRLVKPIQKSGPEAQRLETSAHRFPSTGQPGEHSAAASNGMSTVTLEKIGPKEARLGQNFHYELVIRNRGSTAAERLRVEDELTQGLRLVRAEPQPAVQGERLIWSLSSVGPGSEQRLRVEVQPVAAGEWTSNPTLSVSTPTSFTTRVIAARVGLAVDAPSFAEVGKPAVFEVFVTNSSKQSLSGLVLKAVLPAGLEHPLGSDIEADIGVLGPGASKNIKLTTTAVQSGAHTLEVEVTLDQRTETRSKATVRVNGNGVEVRLTGPVQILLERDGQFRIEVGNFAAAPVRNAEVVATLPEGLEFSAAGDRGIYRSSTRTVHWMVDYLPSQQTRTLTLRAQGKTAGKYQVEGTVRAVGGKEVRSATTVQVEGAAALSVRVVDRDDPLEVGKETVYEVRVFNQGTSAATGIKVAAVVPQGMRPLDGQGPTACQVEGQRVSFAPLAKIAAQSNAVYQVRTQALAPGDRRLQVSLTSDQLASPLTREERTWVYRD
jgi:hypothetical protein